MFLFECFFGTKGPSTQQVSGLFLFALLFCSVLSVPAHADPAVVDLPSQFNLSALVKVPSHGVAIIHFNSQRNGHGYELRATSGQLSLYEAKGDLIGRSSANLPNFSTVPIALTIQRRQGNIGILAGTKVAILAQDIRFSGGSADTSVSRGATITNLRCQPLEPINFTDDFMRLPDVAGEWTYSTGNWQIQTVGTIAWGANPFSLEAEGNPSGFAYAGYPFWSDYQFEAAAKGTPVTSIGLAANVQDEKNYDLLQWSPGDDGVLSLVKVIDGKSTVLATRPGGFIPTLWYKLSLQTSCGRLMAWVDGQLVFNVADDTFGEGKIGLWCEGPVGQPAHFDSVVVRPAVAFSDEFGPHRPAWAPIWSQDDGRKLAGDPTWRNYTISASVVGTKKPSALLLRYTDGHNYAAYSWEEHRSELFVVERGHRRVLFESPHGVAVGEKASIEAGVDADYFWAALNGQRAAEGVDPSLTSGRAGFQPGAEGAVQSIQIRLVVPPDPTDTVTTEFTNTDHHKEMRGWSGDLNAWEPAVFGHETGYWHKGCLFGDLIVKVPLTETDTRVTRFSVVLNGDGQTTSSGYELQFLPDTRGITFNLLRHGERVAVRRIKAPKSNQWPIILEINRQGSFIYVGLADRMVLRYQDPHPLDGYSMDQPLAMAADKDGHNRLGIVIHNFMEPDLAHVVVSSRHVYAETFHLAPVNWRPQSGDWGITSRWACTPGWTWYGGKSTGYAVNWFKSPLWGDQSLDTYTGVMMAAVPDSLVLGYKEDWRDLDLAFCSDGVNLFSGYTLEVASSGGITRLYRKGKVVAETSVFKFPVYQVAHRLWFNTRIIKQGGHLQIDLSYYGEDAQLHTFPLFDWTDPNPISGGFAGFWTWDNGMMIARAVLSAQQIGPQPFYSDKKVWIAREPDTAPYPSFPDAGAPAQPLVAAPVLTAATGTPAPWAR